MVDLLFMGLETPSVICIARIVTVGMQVGHLSQPMSIDVKGAFPASPTACGPWGPGGISLDATKPVPTPHMLDRRFRLKRISVSAR